MDPLVHPLVSYSNNPTETTVETHFLHGSTYRELHLVITSEIHRLRTNVIHFPHTHIPNYMKFVNLPRREMFGASVELPGRYEIHEIFGNYYEGNNSSEYIIHSPGTIVVIIPGLPTSVVLKPNSSLWIKKGDGREKNIVFCVYDPCVIVLETVVAEIPSSEPPCSGALREFQYDFPDLTYKSFLRKRCSNEEVRKALRFVSIAGVEVVATNMVQPAMIAITIIDINAEILMSRIITPRNPIKHFKSNIHHLNANDIEGQYDEYECKKDLKLRLDGKIIVGFKVIPEMLDIMEIGPERILGVRELRTAQCAAAKGFSSAKGFTLNFLMKRYGMQKRKNENLLWTAITAQEIRALYIAMEKDWIDDYTPAGQYPQDTRAQESRHSLSQQMPSQYPQDTRVNLRRETVATQDAGQYSQDTRVWERGNLTILPTENISLQTIEDEIGETPQDIARVKEEPVVAEPRKWSKECYFEPIAQVKEEPVVAAPRQWSKPIHYTEKPANLDDDEVCRRTPVKRSALHALKCPELTLSDVPATYEASIATINGEPPRKQLFGVHAVDRGGNSAITVGQREFRFAAAVYSDGRDRTVVNIVDDRL